MEEILINLTIGIFGGFGGGILVYLYQKRTERVDQRKDVINQIKTAKKILPSDIMNFIDIGMNISKLNEFLGLPTYSFEIDDREIRVDGLRTNLNSYYFENCSLKITHSNNQLTSYIIQSYPKSSIEFDMPNSDFEKSILGKFAVDSSFQETKEEIDEIICESNYRESWFGIIMYFGRRGGYYNYCYYGDLPTEYSFQKKIEIKDLIGQIIDAYGVSCDPNLFKYHTYY